MSKENESGEANIYEIRIDGHLDVQWSDWFDELTFTHASDGTTMLTGEIVDDAALYGLLKKVRDLGLTLLSFNRIEPNNKGDIKSDAKGG